MSKSIHVAVNDSISFFLWKQYSIVHVLCVLILYAVLSRSVVSDSLWAHGL